LKLTNARKESRSSQEKSENQGAINIVSVSTSEAEKCYQITSEVLGMQDLEVGKESRIHQSNQMNLKQSSSGNKDEKKMQDPEEGEEDRTSPPDQMNFEKYSSGSKDQSRTMDPRTSDRIRKQPVTRGNDF
jgi:hypothetical protein